jgi:PAS domain S-box-containing protein
MELSWNEIFVFKTQSLVIDQVNTGAVDNLGYSIQELTHLKITDLMPNMSESLFIQHTQELTNGKKSQIVLESIFRRKDGSVYPVELRIQLSHSEVPPIYLANVQNITQRKKMEDINNAKIAAEKANQEKSEFLGNISHELRTPMHAINSFSNLGLKNLKKNEPNLEKVEGFLEKISISGNRLLNLLNDLLDYSKLENKKMDLRFSRTDIVSIVNKSIDKLSSLTSDKGIKIETNFEKPEIEVELDASKITQVVINLMSNAIKFSPDNSSINISIFSTKDENEEINSIKFSINDFGVGVPENELTTIFNPFSQSSKTKTGAGGTGLGLAICREIIKVHHGKIWCESVEGNGAIFSFQIPINQPLPQNTSNNTSVQQ